MAGAPAPARTPAPPTRPARSRRLAPRRATSGAPPVARRRLPRAITAEPQASSQKKWAVRQEKREERVATGRRQEAGGKGGVRERKRQRPPARAPRTIRQLFTADDRRAADSRRPRLAVERRTRARRRHCRRARGPRERGGVGTRDACSQTGHPALVTAELRVHGRAGRVARAAVVGGKGSRGSAGARQLPPTPIVSRRKPTDASTCVARHREKEIWSHVESTGWLQLACVANAPPAGQLDQLGPAHGAPASEKKKKRNIRLWRGYGGATLHASPCELRGGLWAVLVRQGRHSYKCRGYGGRNADGRCPSQSPPAAASGPATPMWGRKRGGERGGDGSGDGPFPWTKRGRGERMVARLSSWRWSWDEEATHRPRTAQPRGR